MSTDNAYTNDAVPFKPWLRDKLLTGEMKKKQEQWHNLLRNTYNCEIHESAYVSPDANVFPEDGGIFCLGANSWVASRCVLRGGLTVGENCSFNVGVLSIGKVTIGNDVRIAANSQLMGFNHGFERVDIPLCQQAHSSKGIIIEDDVWVGANVIILDGVTIGSHSVLAAGSVITKDVPAYSIVGGCPGKILKNRLTGKKPSQYASLEKRLETFGKKVKEQLPDLLQNNLKEWRGEMTYIDAEWDSPDITSWCQVVELAAAFDHIPDQLPREQLVAKLQSFQDEKTGLFNQTPWGESVTLLPPEKGQGDYGILAVGYALEILGEKLKYPIRAIDELSVNKLYSLLNKFPWDTTAWYCGSWVDSLGTAMYFNHKYFGLQPKLEALFGWLNLHIDRHAGVWGSWTDKEEWLHPVNGFYRLTRGTYAQFGVDLPYPENSIDTILRHARNKRYFNDSAGNCCNTLDVAHPLWLCQKQSGYRSTVIRDLAAQLLERPLSRWLDGQGLSFTLEQGKHPSNTPCIKYTEQWLATMYLLADLLDCSQACGYKPKGIHRTETVKGIII